MSMQLFEAAAAEFLALNRIAVAGVSRSGKDTGNGIHKALKDRGYAVFALNPNADEIAGQPCYASLREIPGGVDGVIIVTAPEAGAEVVNDAIAAGVRHVWMHNNTLLPSSVSDAAIEAGRAAGLTIIAGGCPMMFFDIGHKCMKWVLGAVGRMPPPVINFSKN